MTSPTPEFASGYATAVVAEYLKFQEEQRAQTSESALLMLTREIQRLSQELKATNQRIIAYAKEHGIKSDAQSPELQSLRDDRDRIRELYNTLFEQLMKIDVSTRFLECWITVLDPVTIEPKGRP